MQCKDQQQSDALANITSEIAALSSSSEVELLGPGQSVPTGCAPNVVDDAMIVYLLLTGILDPQKELDKLAKDQVGLKAVDWPLMCPVAHLQEGHQRHLSIIAYWP